MRRRDDDPFRGESDQFRQSVPEPFLLDDEKPVALDADSVGVFREVGEQRDLGIHPPVLRLDLQEREGGMAIDRLAFRPDAWSRIVQGQPKICFRGLLRDPVHGNVLTPEAAQPSLDAPGNLDVPDVGIIRQVAAMYQCRNFEVRTAGQILQAVLQHRQRATLPDVYR